MNTPLLEEQHDAEQIEREQIEQIEENETNQESIQPTNDIIF